MSLTARLQPLLRRAYTKPFKSKSDYARTHAPLLAAAQSEGLITTMMPGVGYTDTWRITAEGINALILSVREYGIINENAD